MIASAALSLLVAFVAIPACCLRDVATRTSVRLLGTCQITAAVGVLVTAILYPIGWSAREVRESCGWTSSAYHLGACRIGWAFYALVACGLALFVCALLSTNAAKPVQWKKVPPIGSDENGTNEMQPLNGRRPM